MSGDGMPGVPLDEALSGPGTGRALAGSPFLQIDSECRLYFQPRDDAYGGFEFCAVEWVCSELGVPNDDQQLSHPSARVEVLLSGTAYYDGVVHMNVGDEEGYLHYPRLRRIAAVMTALDDLTRKHCSMPDG